MAEVFVLAAATLPIIDIIITRGSQLARRIEDHRKLAVYSENLRFFTVDVARAKLKAQFSEGQHVVNSLSTDTALREALNSIFQKIQTTIFEANTALDDVDAKAKKPFWVSKRPERDLETCVKNMKALEEEFDSIIRMVDRKNHRSSDVMLSSAVFQIWETITPILSSDIRLARCQLKRQVGRIAPKTGTFLIESHISVPEDVRDLAETLSAADASDGILDVVGYRPATPNSNDNQFELVFNFPEGQQLCGSLQHLVQTMTRPPPSLNTRLYLCKDLASAVLHVHNIDMVHKNISTANIIVTASQQALQNALLHTLPYRADSSVFLLDWQLSRKSNRATQAIGGGDWWRRVYQHPTRHVQHPEHEYTMSHDVYSLGVCMLEVLLWKPFVTSTAARMFEFSQFFQESIGEYREAHPDTPINVSEGDPATADGWDIQTMLIFWAKTKLPAAAGDRLAEVVVCCLTCLEDGFEPEIFSSGNATETGLNFVKGVLSTLRTISI